MDCSNRCPDPAAINRRIITRKICTKLDIIDLFLILYTLDIG